MTDLSLMSGDADPEAAAHPQPLFKLLRDAGPIVDMGGDSGEAMVLVGGDAEVRHVLSHPEVFSSGIDAVAIGQVRPLIPGTSRSMVIVTSRSRLSGLVIRDGAHRTTLDTLTEAESVDLLTATTSVYRSGDRTADIAELARLCARLPLALRIAA